MTKLSEYMRTAEAAEYLGVYHSMIRKLAALRELETELYQEAV